MNCSPPGSSIHGIVHARILQWVAISFSRGSSPPRDRTQVSRIAGRRFNLWATREAQQTYANSVWIGLWIMEIWEFIFHKQHILLLRMLHLPPSLSIKSINPGLLCLSAILFFHAARVCSPCCVPEPKQDAVNTMVNRQGENNLVFTALAIKKKKILSLWHLQFPGDAVVKNLYANAGNAGSVPGWGRSPGEGNGNPLQYSCLENPIDRGVLWATVHGVAKIDWALRHAWHGTCILTGGHSEQAHYKQTSQWTVLKCIQQISACLCFKRVWIKYLCLNQLSKASRIVLLGIWNGN